MVRAAAEGEDSLPLLRSWSLLLPASVCVEPETVSSSFHLQTNKTRFVFFLSIQSLRTTFEVFSTTDIVPRIVPEGGGWLVLGLIYSTEKGMPPAPHPLDMKTSFLDSLPGAGSAAGCCTRCSLASDV